MRAPIALFSADFHDNRYAICALALNCRGRFAEAVEYCEMLLVVIERCYGRNCPEYKDHLRILEVIQSLAADSA